MKHGKEKAKKQKTKSEESTLIWIYRDSDHGDLELFTSKEDAIKYAKAQWPDEEEWDEDGDFAGGYVSIFSKTIHSEVNK